MMKLGRVRERNTSKQFTLLLFLGFTFVTIFQKNHLLSEYLNCVPPLFYTTHSINLLRILATDLQQIILVMGHAASQLVEALRYKPEGRGFDSRWCHCNFSLTQSYRPQYGPGVDSASERNEYQKYFLGVKGDRWLGLTTYHLHVPIVLKSGSHNLLEPSGPVQTCKGMVYILLVTSENAKYRLCSSVMFKFLALSLAAASTRETKKNVSQ